MWPVVSQAISDLTWIGYQHESSPPSEGGVASAEPQRAKRMTGWSSNRRLQASIIALDPKTGHILAMVGGRDYRESQFNRATDALRAPGSTFKPIVYATAYERGYTPISVSSDTPTEFALIGGKPYKPENYRGAYAMTNVTLKHALVKSSNVVAVRTAMDVGLGKVADKARDFGFENVTAWPSMALGTLETTPLQLAAAYAVFANGGKRVEPTFIDRVVSGDDKLLYMSLPNEKQIIRENVAYMITDALTSVVKQGTAAKANGALGNVVFAGKTGSTKDGWFVGYTPNLVTVAWVGLDDNEDLHATGGDIALPMWVDFMKEVIKLRPEYGGTRFNMPRGLTEVTVDPETGMAAGPYCPQRETAIVPTTAAVHVRCLKHEPLETMFAMYDSEEVGPDIAPMATDVPATYAEIPDGASDADSTPPSDRRVIVTYEDYSKGAGELNIRRSQLEPKRIRDDERPSDARFDPALINRRDRVVKPEKQPRKTQKDGKEEEKEGAFEPN